MTTCPKCRHVWRYTGDAEWICCPSCHRKFRRPATVIEPIGPPAGVTEQCDVCGRPVDIIQPCRIDGEAAFVCPACLSR